MTRYGMVIDLERCYGCRECMQACKTENNTPRGVHWMNVLRFETGEFPDVDQHFVPRPCQHCQDAPCIEVCPTNARFKRDDGIVLCDYDDCIGCKYCSVSCPYDVNFVQEREHTEGQYGFGNDSWDLVDAVKKQTPPWENPDLNRDIEPREEPMAGGDNPEGTVSKCTFCAHRQDDPEKQGTTACAEACPADAISFGDMTDPESDPRQHLREKEDAKTFRMHEEMDTEPNIIYIGEEPEEAPRSVSGHDQYKDPKEAIEDEKDLEHRGEA